MTSGGVARKKRRTIGGMRIHALRETLDQTEASVNFSLNMVPEDELECTERGIDRILVAVRVRPLSATEVSQGKRSCCDVLNSTTMAISKRAATGAYLRSQQGSVNEYTFDHVFPPETSQSTVYEKTAKPFITDLLNGINVTVFAYGATGAGKTHTMMGSERVFGASLDESTEVTGIVPQSLVDVFREIRQREAGVVGGGMNFHGGDVEWSVRVGYLEVYNEQILDLLSPSDRPLKINEDPSRGKVVVAGLTE
ncbi:unnamed protein product, partial [Choristocarpus tenellus]